MAKKKNRAKNRAKKRESNAVRKRPGNSSKVAPKGGARSGAGGTSPQSATEERTTEAVTVGLILSAMALFLAEAIVVGTRFAMFVSPELRGSIWPHAIARLMLAVAATTGAVCLILNPIVARMRDVKLPLAVTVGITIAALAPYAALLVMQWR